MDGPGEISRLCSSVQRSLRRLLVDISSVESARFLDSAFMKTATSVEHRALAYPQSDLIANVLADLMQVLPELGDQGLVGEHRKHYTSLVDSALARFSGRTAVSIRRCYGPNGSDLWNWPTRSRVPDWFRQFMLVVDEASQTHRVAIESVETMDRLCSASNPMSIAGHMMSSMLMEFIAEPEHRTLYHAVDSSAAIDRREIRPSDDIDWERLRHLTLQLEGEAKLIVERTYCGWRFASTSIL